MGAKEGKQRMAQRHYRVLQNQLVNTKYTLSPHGIIAIAISPVSYVRNISKTRIFLEIFFINRLGVAIYNNLTIF